MHFSELEAVYKKYLYLDHDPMLLRLIYSAVVANRIDGNPIWLLLIGKAGGGKTQLLTSLYDAPHVHHISTLTPNALASGSGEEFSLLFELDEGILIVEDMSGISSLPREAKQTIYSFLRQAYNGEFNRRTGRGSIDWEGKFGMLCASTVHIEWDRANESALGERFLYVRLRDVDDREMIRAAKRNTGRRSIMKDDLRSASRRFLESFRFNHKERKLPRDLIQMIEDCAIALSRCRSSVMRDGYSKEIIFPAESTEVGTRLNDQFILMALAARAIGTDWSFIRDMILRLTLDSLPYMRYKALRAVHAGGKRMVDISAKMGINTNPAQRVLEECRALGLLGRDARKEYVITEPVFAHALDAVG